MSEKQQPVSPFSSSFPSSSDPSSDPSPQPPTTTLQQLTPTGTPSTIYISTATTSGHSRVDVVQPARTAWEPLTKRVADAFLPVGFPESVGGDYLRYQIFDSAQAFLSSIASLLASRAVLTTLGIGSSTSTPQSALLLTVTQETLSRLATIAFAARLGTAIEPECKMYRLLADVFNDAAMLLDCASPLLSEGGVAAFGAGVGQAVKVSVLASSSVLRALCGVAAGSAKGCLSAHFARRGNLGEVGAKDAAQETVVSLLGTLVGTGVVSYVTGAWATWVALGLLLVGHLACNWAAVRSVTLRSLNRQRAGLVYCELVERGKLLGPEEVSGRERIFERTDVLRWKGSVVGYVLFGATVVEMLGNSGKKDRASGAYHDVSPSLDELQGVFHKERYIMSWNDGNRRVVVVLKRQANNSDKLKAWVNALIVAKLYAARAGQSGHVGHSKRASRLQLLEEALEQTSALFTENVLTSLGDTGWDLQIAALELKPASTIA